MVMWRDIHGKIPAPPAVVKEAAGRGFSAISTSASRPSARKKGPEISVRPFRPFVHRTGPLLCLAIFVLALIGLLELGFYRLPQADLDLGQNKRLHGQRWQATVQLGGEEIVRRAESRRGSWSNTITGPASPIRTPPWTNWTDVVMSAGFTTRVHVRNEFVMHGTNYTSYSSTANTVFTRSPNITQIGPRPYVVSVVTITVTPTPSPDDISTPDMADASDRQTPVQIVPTLLRPHLASVTQTEPPQPVAPGKVPSQADSAADQGPSIDVDGDSFGPSPALPGSPGPGAPDEGQGDTSGQGSSEGSEDALEVTEAVLAAMAVANIGSSDRSAILSALFINKGNIRPAVTSMSSSVNSTEEETVDAPLLSPPSAAAFGSLTVLTASDGRLLLAFPSITSTLTLPNPASSPRSQGSAFTFGGTPIRPPAHVTTASFRHDGTKPTTLGLRVMTSTILVAPAFPTVEPPIGLVPPFLPDTRNSTVPLTLLADPSVYFLYAYFPVLVAVALRLLCSPIYRYMKLMDPFLMLSRPDGALASEFLESDYLGNDPFFAPFQAIGLRRWILLATSMLCTAAQLITTLAAELTLVYSSRHIEWIPGGFVVVQGQALWINRVIGRIIEALLAVMVVLLIGLCFVLRGNAAAMTTNPASIASMASLASHPSFVAHLNAAAEVGTNATLADELSKRRYVLGHFINEDGVKVNGIVPFKDLSVPDEAMESDPSRPKSEPRSSMRTVRAVSGKKLFAARQALPLTKLRRLYPLLLLTSMSLILFFLVLAYTLNHDATPFEEFMDSESFGPPFLLTMLSLFLKSSLMYLSTRILVHVPFRRLARQPRRADTDISSPVPLTPYGAIVYALRRREWFAASMAVASGVVIEMMVIMIPGVPYHRRQIIASALASRYVCFACLATFMVVAAAIWYRTIRGTGGEHCWRNSPIRIGSVCRHLVGSRMAGDMATTLAAVESDVNMDKGKRGGGSFQARFRRKLDRPDALYDFKVRGGKWTVDYASVPSEEAGSEQQTPPVHAQSCDCSDAPEGLRDMKPKDQVMVVIVSDPDGQDPGGSAAEEAPTSKR